MYTTAISNLAWPPSEVQEALKLITKHRIQGLEIAPGLTWADGCDVPNDELNSWKTTLDSINVRPVAMQAYLYGKPDCTLFTDDESRRNLIAHTTHCILNAGDLGISAVIFGAPKSKKRGDVSKEEADQIAIETFRSLGDKAKKSGIYFCIEPTPELYGADYLTSTDEVTALLEQINHSHVALNLDFGTLKTEKQFSIESIKRYLPRTRHIHISEPNLAFIDLLDERHRATSGFLKKSKYAGTVSIEMNIQKQWNADEFDKILYWFSDLYGGH